MMAPVGVSVADFVRQDFDYLIVGGGTAGLAVAARLSDDPSLNVGVLEAGPAALGEDAINEPGRCLQTLGTEYDWQFETTPQPGLGGRTLAWPRGKVLGGTSALNLMTWNRGSRQDYDAWEELGNRGWGWDDLLPYFKKSESFHPPEKETRSHNRQYYDHEAVGTSGPIQTSYSKQYPVTHQLCHDAYVSLGIGENKAHHAGSNVGVWTNMSTVDPESSTRSYAASAYYAPVSARPNLFVLTEALVKNVVLSHEVGQWTATGVRFSRAGEEFVASALREVIVSAGSIQSPQLLELSGVGDPQVLSDAGIEVKVASSNVGENLQDHLMTVSVFEIDPAIARPSPGAPACVVCYLPVSVATPDHVSETLASKARALGLLPLEKGSILKNRFEPGADLGQFEYIFDLGNWNSNFKPGGAGEGKSYCSMLQILQYPFSKGSVHIRPPTGMSSDSSSAADKPVIDAGYYAGPHGELDLDVMAHCIRFTDKLCASAPLSDVVGSRVYPPSSVTSDEQWRDWVVENTTTDWHPVGTCAMGGHGGIGSGVVDERLRVYGVDRLRVIDASIMPLQISAHLQATVYAIAEKGADMIREDMVERREPK
ncbi:putative choline dehydrogenase [Biscogniauxia mediterranea]|nr:putative choline dehydrogenase [Biscogniauxia mediterranea]